MKKFYLVEKKSEFAKSKTSTNLFFIFGLFPPPPFFAFPPSTGKVGESKNKKSFNKWKKGRGSKKGKKRQQNRTLKLKIKN